ncbi:MAG: transforming growth factor-beta-induced protein [Flavobacteriales bacterium]|jgi:transforming growth factor-beta-induced protein
MLHSILKYSLVSFAFAQLIACGGDDNNNNDIDIPQEPVTVADTAAASENFSTLVVALEAAGLTQTLDDPDASYTVFAPTNAAFAALDEDVLNALLADPEALSNVLLYHVVDSEINSAAAVSAAGSKVSMVNGDMIAVSLNGDNLYVNTSLVTDIDIQTDNGVIHAINKVLIPPGEIVEPTLNVVEIAVADDRFETLVVALTEADLVATLSDPDASFTVFAPTDDAFAALSQPVIDALLANEEKLTALLLKHVLDAEVDSLTALTLNGSSTTTLNGDVEIAIVDGQLTVGGATVIIEDIKATNGVIHVIDTVIADQADLPSIAEIAVATPTLSTLVAALTEADLVGAVSDESATYTVFAPTDAAFGDLLVDLDLSAGELLALDSLSDILLYHLLGAEVDAAAAIAAAGTTVETANTAMNSVGIAVIDGNVYINGAQVVIADIRASNGVIHVVDKVLLPPAEKPEMLESNIVETAIAAGDFDVLVQAVTEAALADALADETAMYTVFAPNDDAFTQLLADLSLTTEELLELENLGTILGLHVVSGAEVDSINAYAAAGTSVTTLDGTAIAITLMDGDLYFGGAKIITTDIYTNNGVIHVLDSVVLSE